MNKKGTSKELNVALTANIAGHKNNKNNTILNLYTSFNPIASK